MKKFLFLISIIFTITACDNEPEKQPEKEVGTEVSDSIQVFQGSYISVGESAVLKGDKFIYQVKMDSVATILNDSLSSFQVDEKGIVPIKIRGKIRDNLRGIGYSQEIEIIEVLDIMAKPIIEIE